MFRISFSCSTLVGLRPALTCTRAPTDRLTHSLAVTPVVMMRAWHQLKASCAVVRGEESEETLDRVPPLLPVMLIHMPGAKGVWSEWGGLPGLGSPPPAHGLPVCRLLDRAEHDRAIVAHLAAQQGVVLESLPAYIYVIHI